MKKIMMALLVTASTSSAFAVGADMITVRYNCVDASLTNSAKPTITAQMLVGGFAGLTQIRVTKKLKAKKSVETYIVKLDNPKNAPVGGASVYRGQDGMSFSINQTTSPMMPRKATLVENGVTTKMLCELNKKVQTN